MNRSYSGFSSFLSELQRRRVFRVAAVYAATAFVIAQVADIAAPGLNLPEWSLSLILLLLILGFPLAVALAWIFDIGPTGIERTRSGRGRNVTPGRVASDAGPLAEVGTSDRQYRRDVANSRPRHGSCGAPDDAVRPSVAVLPFADLSPGKDQEYFADGLTEETAQRVDSGAGAPPARAHQQL